MNPSTATAMLAPDYRRARVVRAAPPRGSLLERIGTRLRNWRLRRAEPG